MTFPSSVKSFMLIEAVNHSVGTYKLKLLVCLLIYWLFEPSICLFMSTLLWGLNALFS